MNKKLEYWGRWFLVFPGALLVSLLATFPLHWLLYFTLANGETVSGVNIKPIEYMLYPFVIAIIFILAGSKIAPKYKFKTAIILFGIYIATWFTINFLVLSGDFYGMQFSGRAILSLIGACIGLFLAKKDSKIFNQAKFGSQKDQ